MKTISILNLKGGVAKTFTAANMAYEIYRRGYRVLLIDNDKQGNLSKAYSRYDAESVAPVTRLLAGDWQGATELIQNTDYVGQQCCIDIVTSNMSLFGATWNLTKEDSENQTERYKRFADIMGGFYDYCIIDNPPAILMCTINALCAADEVIIPVRLDNWSIDGVDVITEQIEALKALNSNLKIAGILLTDYKKSIENEAAEEWLRKNCKYNVFSRRIRHSDKAVSATYYKQPLETYSPRSAAATDYRKFMEEYTGTKKA